MVYAKPTLETNKRNAALQERKEMRGKSELITEVGKAPSKEVRCVCCVPLECDMLSRFL